IGEHLERAVAEAQQAVPCRVAEFTAGPRYSAPQKPVPCHEYVMEFDPPPADLRQFTHALDEAMRRQSHDYDVKRTGDVGMDCPRLHVVSRGTFFEWM